MYSEEMKHIAPYAGMYCCRRDRELTLLYGTESLAELTGYSAEAWGSVLRGSLAAVICPEARKSCLDLVAHLLHQHQ